MCLSNALLAGLAGPIKESLKVPVVCLLQDEDSFLDSLTEPYVGMAWDEIASFHLGDNPERKEPTTGEINYKNIFKHLHKKGYKGVLCMEHGRSKPGKQGEMAVIEAYRACDDFEV